MANKVLLRRSSTAAAIPTTGQLDLGEIALNTRDGSAFFKRNNGTDTITKIWTDANDGIGSGLDADLLDGVHVGTSGAAIGRLDTANTWNNNQVIAGTSSGNMLSVTNAGTGAGISTDRILISELDFTNSYSQEFSQSYSPSAYYTAGEYQEICTITPAANSMNYTLVGEIFAQAGASTQVIRFTIGLRSNVLPSLSYDGTWTEILYSSPSFFKPALWLNLTTGVFKFVIAHQTGTVHNVNVTLAIHKRVRSYTDCVMNTTVTSDTNIIPSGFTQVEISKTYSESAGVITYTNAPGTVTALGGTTIGSNLLTLTNPNAVTFPRFNADNTVSALDAASFRAAIGAGTSSSSGTVTSVALALPNIFSVTGSPVTVSGTLTGALVSQTAKTFLAAPNAAAGVPSFRTIVASDIPTLNQNTTGTAANVTGTVAIANGGTGATTAVGARTNLGAAESIQQAGSAFDFNSYIPATPGLLRVVWNSGDTSMVNAPNGNTTGFLLASQGQHNRWNAQLFMEQGSDGSVWNRGSSDIGGVRTWGAWKRLDQLDGQSGSYYQNASNLNAGIVPDARISGTYSGFTHKLDGSNTVYTTPNTGTQSSFARTVYGLAEYRSNSSAQVGAIVFYAPDNTATIMHQLEVQGMLYNQSIVSLKIQGYRSGATTFTDLRKISSGTVDVQVRWGIDASGKTCLILGDVGTSWSYPHFSITRAMFSHNAVTDSYCAGWSVGTVTSLTGFTVFTTIADSAIVGSVTGNAATATALQTSRTIGISGGVTGTATSFNGSTDITIPITAMNASSLTTGTVPDARISGSYTGLTNLTGTGTVDFSKFYGNAADSATAPSFSWTGDTNTGIYSPGGDQLAISTGGSQRALFSSSGATIPVITMAATLTMPTHWARDSLLAGVGGTGWIGTNGAYATSIYNNGYRNSSNGFTYMGINGVTNKAGGIDILPTEIQFRAGTAQGTTLPLLAQISETGFSSNVPITAASFNSITGLGTTTTALGTSSGGSATTVSKSDHVHAMPTLANVTAAGNLATSGLSIPAGETNSYGFWGSQTSFSISMGQSAGTYQYGPVTSYSIKMNMDSGTGRGFTWGRYGIAPIAALNAISGDMQIAGAFQAASKSFLIDHPTKEGMKLQYGSLESPYHGVRLTGESFIDSNTKTIHLPEYIRGLCKQEGSQVQITNIKHGNVLWVEDILVDENKFVVGTITQTEKQYKFYWSFTAIRKDIADLIVESKDKDEL